jgi:Fe-S cluster assembly ATP-binding protein
VLSIRNLTASINNTAVIKGLDLEINAGEVHAIMGPNGSGKSTIGKILAGHPSYNITHGDITFEGYNLLEKTADERAQAGIFLGFQYPIEIPGVSNISFLRLAYNKKMTAAGKEELDPLEFEDFIQEKARFVGMDNSFLERSLNEGFSGGEKKRNEILQMCILDPKLAILDELDSGLDIDTVQVLGKAVTALINPNKALIIITHFPRILEVIKPQRVHVLHDGHIVKTGGIELAFQLEEQGYNWLKSEVAPTVII